MLIVIYFMSVSQRVLNLAFIAVVSVWMSKYVYDGDTNKISNHNKFVLGISNSAVLVIAPFLGLLFDRCGELVVIPLNYFIASAPYIGLYFLTDFKTTLAYGLQIIGTISSILNNSLGFMILARHAPPVGAGKIFAVNRVFAGIIQIGMSYFLGWVVDQSFNKIAFLIVGGFGLMVVFTFLLISMLCRNWSKVYQ